MFKVGDKVKITTFLPTCYAGKEGTIKDIAGKVYFIKFGNKDVNDLIPFLEGEFEMVKDEVVFKVGDKVVSKSPRLFSDSSRIFEIKAVVDDRLWLWNDKIGDFVTPAEDWMLQKQLPKYNKNDIVVSDLGHHYQIVEAWRSTKSESMDEIAYVVISVDDFKGTKRFNTGILPEKYIKDKAEELKANSYYGNVYDKIW